MTTEIRMHQIKFELFHTHDGPLTKFIAIYRAVELAAKGEYNAEEIANALHEGLQDFQELPSSEFNAG